MEIHPGAPAPSAEVKNPVREHGASSMEKAIYSRGLIAPKTTWLFVPARESGAFRLFHVTHEIRFENISEIQFVGKNP
jgi:hypothetical protein